MWRIIRIIWKLIFLIKEFLEHLIGAAILGVGAFLLPSVVYQQAALRPGATNNELYGLVVQGVGTFGFLLVVSSLVTVFGAIKHDFADDDGFKRMQRVRWFISIVLSFTPAFASPTPLGPLAPTVALAYSGTLIYLALHFKDERAVALRCGAFAILGLGWWLAAVDNAAWQLYLWCVVVPAATVAWSLLVGLFSELREMYGALQENG